MEVQSVAVRYWEVDTFLNSGDTALLQHADGFVAAVGARGRRLILLGPDGTTASVRKHDVRRALRPAWELAMRQGIEGRLERVAIPPRRRERAVHRLIEMVNSTPPALQGWVLRLPPEARFSRQMARAGLVRPALSLVGAHVAQYALYLASWWAIGVGLLQGRSSVGWLLAWAGLLLTAIPLRLLTVWQQGRFALGLGTLLKRRLLHGAMRMRPDDLRHQGVGGFLGRSMEAEQVESVGLSGGIASALALLEIIMAGAVLAGGAGGPWHAAGLALWLALALWMGVGLARRRAAWNQGRIDLTDTMVERMIGHRTRLVQCLPERWHHGEDEALWSYHERARSMDHWQSLLMVVRPVRLAAAGRDHAGARVHRRRQPGVAGRGRSVALLLARQSLERAQRPG